MLVALALLALFASYLPQAYGLVRRTWTMSAQLAHDDPEQAARTFLRTGLSEAMPVFERRSEGDQLVFSGTAESVTFVAPLRNAPRGSGLYRFKLFQGADARGRGALQVSLEPYATALQRDILQRDIDRPPPALDVQRLAPASSLGVRYFGRPAPREKPQWMSSWPRFDALPDLVEISLQRENGTAVAPVVVELRMRSGL